MLITLAYIYTLWGRNSRVKSAAINCNKLSGVKYTQCLSKIVKIKVTTLAISCIRYNELTKLKLSQMIYYIMNSIAFQWFVRECLVALAIDDTVMCEPRLILCLLRRVVFLSCFFSYHCFPSGPFWQHTNFTHVNTKKNKKINDGNTTRRQVDLWWAAHQLHTSDSNPRATHSSKMIIRIELAWVEEKRIIFGCFRAKLRLVS